MNGLADVADSGVKNGDAGLNAAGEKELGASLKALFRELWLSE